MREHGDFVGQDAETEIRSGNRRSWSYAMTSINSPIELRLEIFDKRNMFVLELISIS